MMIQKKRNQKLRRAVRTRAKLHGTAERPRLSVHRTAKHMSAQFIDDDASKTICGVHGFTVGMRKVNTVKLAEEFGKKVAAAAAEKGIASAVYDRGPYLYHGRVKAFADAVRAAGITM